MHANDGFPAIQRDVDEELQATDGGIQRLQRDAVIYQVEVIPPQILDGGGIGRAPEILRKIGHGTLVSSGTEESVSLLEPAAQVRKR